MQNDGAPSSEQIYQHARYMRLKAERDRKKAPDPIQTLSAEDKEHIAGLIDKKGSIYVVSEGRRPDRTVYPVVAIVATDKQVIEWAAKRLDAIGPFVQCQSKDRKASAVQYGFKIAGKRAKLLCETLLPRLKVKRKQASLVVRFPYDGRAEPGGRVQKTAMNEERFRIQDKVRRLNQRTSKQPAPDNTKGRFVKAEPIETPIWVRKAFLSMSAVIHGRSPH
jgi:hypothetical protein